MDLLIMTLVVAAIAAALALIRWIDLEGPTSGQAPRGTGDEWSPDLPSHPYGS